MHGRVKSKEGISDAEQTQLREKAAKYRKLLSLVLARRHDCASPETQTLTSQLLRVNPDISSAWNMRRDRLVSSAVCTKDAGDRLLPSIRMQDGGEVGMMSAEDMRVELQLTYDGIRKNPKSYGAWHHRLWLVLQQAQASSEGPCDEAVVDVKEELELCAQLLRADARNFHCWNYRRAVVHVTAAVNTADDVVIAQEEFAFSTRKIEENFSNYSAFHHRSVFIRRLGRAALDMGAEEFALTESAVYTEPDDQSAWWYRQFLYSWVEADVNARCAEEAADCGARYEQLMQQQLLVLRGLLELEPDSRWALNEVALLLGKLARHQQTQGGGGDSEWGVPLGEERRQVLARLAEVDPAHRRRYNYLLLQ